MDPGFRVKLGLLAPNAGIDLLPFIRALVQPELGWDDTRWNKENWTSSFACSVDSHSDRNFPPRYDCLRHETYTRIFDLVRSLVVAVTLQPRIASLWRPLRKEHS